MTRRKRSTFLKDRRVAVPGAKETPGYRSWSHMRDRCQNPNDASYYKYGERGITVCERWDDLTNFLADMGEPPPGMSLDRIDPDGNYEPKNCRWVTRSQQLINRRVNRDSDHADTPEPFRRKAWELDQACAKAMVEIRELAGPNAAIFLQLWMSQLETPDIEPEQKAKLQDSVRRWMQLDSELAALQLEFPQLQ
jgi:hypothetical protein